MTVSPIEKYQARIDELESLRTELQAASRPDPAPVVGRVLEAAGDLLRRRLKVSCDEQRIDQALAVVPEKGLLAWLDGVKAEDVRSRVERAADQAVDAAIPESDGDGRTLTVWAMQALMARDRLESARFAVERMKRSNKAGASVALERLEKELAAADERSRRCCTRLTALNADRRDELALLDPERRAAAWWLSEKSGLEHDLVVRVLGGEARGSLPKGAQAAHDLVMQKRTRRFSYDELLRFDLGLASPAELEAVRKAAGDDPELKLALKAMEEGDLAIDDVTKDEVPVLRAAPVPPAVEPRSPAPEIVEERSEFRLLVFRAKQRVQVVVQPRRQDRFAAAAVYLPDQPQRSVPHEPGDHGLHFDVGAPERVRGLVAKVVVRLTDGRELTNEVKL
ncbi:MAG: hypothetical protein JNJ54_28845 [Myxococcaceae bacterium]|nr:hypothetical protein [Myxococcaceae bacterium]